jgi:hypothetical protein
MPPKLKASEFEGTGVLRTGVFGLARAWEKLRTIYRTGTTDQPDAIPDDWGTGGEKEGT